MKNILFRTIKLWVGLLLISVVPFILIISISFIDDLKTTIIVTCAGILSIIFGLLLLKRYKSSIQLKENEDIKKNNAKLKKNGFVKKIHYNNLIISSRNESVETTPYFYSKQMEMIDGLAGIEGKKDVKKYEYTILIYKEKRKLYQSTEIKKAPTTLSFLLAKEETIILYIDPNDDNNYFFDLDFLDS